MAGEVSFKSAVDSIVNHVRRINNAREAIANDPDGSKGGIPDSTLWRNYENARRYLCEVLVLGFNDPTSFDFDVHGLTVEFEFGDATKPHLITAAMVRGWVKHPGLTPTYYSSSSSSSSP